MHLTRQKWYQAIDLKKIYSIEIKFTNDSAENLPIPHKAKQFIIVGRKCDHFVCTLVRFDIFTRILTTQ